MKHIKIILAALAILTFGIPVKAAPRKVIAENFTATWCGYCPDVAYGLIMLMEEFPDSFLSMQVHYTDSYDTPWGISRMNFYGYQGLPNVWMDGVSQQLGSYGSPAGNYNNFRQMYLNRQAAGTDVVMEMCGDVLDGDTYTVNINVSVEASGTAKTMRVHCTQTLDNYPSTPSYNYSCLRQGESELITLNPGESAVVSYDFNLDSISAANLNDVNFIAWAQADTGSGPAEIYQAEKHEYNSGDCEIDTFTVGPKGDFQRINYALQAAGTGDTVLVMPGTYFENIDFTGSGVTLVSSDGAEATIIDGRSMASVVWMSQSSGVNAVIDGFTIRNGFSAVGGGIFTNGTPDIKNCIFENNVAKAWGGAIGSNDENANPIVTNSAFCNNSPDHIHGGWTDGGGNVFDDICEGGNECPADVSGDSYVNVTDLLSIIDAWGNVGGSADVNQDGFVDVGDLLEVVGNWGPCE